MTKKPHMKILKFFGMTRNLWRIRVNPTAYEKGILSHLVVDPTVRQPIKDFHRKAST